MRLHVQFNRFLIVGLVSNSALYFFYLVLTYLGLGHKLSMTVLYMIGVSQTFVLNRVWTFAHKGAPGLALLRYVICYALGYILNLFVLWWFVDVSGHRHELVQGIMIISLALMFFLAQRYWIFRQTDAHSV